MTPTPDLVETVANRIEARMGPLVGSPEYLADPVKRARAEARRREGAEAYARMALEEALLAIPDPNPSGQWRDIATAPRDGTVILLGHDKAAFSGWWQTGDDFAGGNGPGWVDGCTNAYDYNVLYDAVTHWQPLPPLPPDIGEESELDGGGGS